VGVLVEVRVGLIDRLPFDDDAFDLVVVHSARGQLASFNEAPAAQAAYDAAGGTAEALRQAGFGAVRDLGDREGLKFSEGLRTV
jgi:hypothetical protein